MNLYFETFNDANKCFEYYVKYNADDILTLRLGYTSHRIWKHTSGGVEYIKNRNHQAVVDQVEFTFIQLSSRVI